MAPHLSFPRRAACVIALLLMIANPMAAHAQPNICDQAAQIVAGETGVPLPVLRAIALAETGRGIGGQHQPWPWAINQGGDGRWFENRAAALAYAQAAIDAGVNNIDIGCFQLNHRWHGAAFASLDQMFDPLANARHAARFLTQLHDESGDWMVAAGHYHSRTPHLSDAYRTRLAALMTDPIPATQPISTPRRSTQYPLLTSGALGAAGSLVPGGRAGLTLLRGPVGRLIGG